MCTNWLQVEEWITDNHFAHWIFYRSNPDKRSDGERANDKIVDSAWYGSDTMDEKLAMTKKYIEQNAGSRLYGVGYQTDKSNSGGASCEVLLSAGSGASNMPAVAPAPAAVAGAFDKDEIIKQVREQVTMEFEKKKYEEERKKLDEERKEFERDKNSAIGTLVGYMKPLLATMAQKAVHGVDSPAPVEAAPIHAVETETVEDAAEGVFTDEEVQEIEELLARFKKVEQEYLTLIRRVVEMAEAGDSTYSMARGFLTK